MPVSSKKIITLDDAVDSLEKKPSVKKPVTLDEAADNLLKKKENPVLSASGSVSVGDGTKNTAQSTSTSPSEIKGADKVKIEAYLQSLKSQQEISANSSIPTKEQAIAAMRKIKPLTAGGVTTSIREQETEANKKSVDEVGKKIYDGTASLEDINSIAKNPEAKPFLESYIRAYSDKDKLPEGDVLAPGAHWGSAWKNSTFENRPIVVKQINEAAKKSDEEIQSIAGNVLEYGQESPYAKVFGDAGEFKEFVPKVDVNNSEQLTELYNKIKSSYSLKNTDGQDLSDKKKSILNAIQFKIDQIERAKPIAEEIEALDSKIYFAIDDIEGGVFEITKKDSTQQQSNVAENKISAFKRGLNYVKATDEATYKNVVRALNDKGQVAEQDYQNIVAKGQQLENVNTFIGGATDKNLIGKETNFSLLTKSTKLAATSGILGETAKQLGIKNKVEFSDKEIETLVKATDWAKYGMKPPTPAEINLIKAKEDQWFYDQIPKTGFTAPILRGFQQPFQAIARTIEDATSGSYAEDYLRSKETDRTTGGEQLTPDEKGRYGTGLASDRGNIWYSVLEGGAAFIPQILLTKGFGAPSAALAESAVASTVPRAALTAAQLSNINTVTGTLLSSYLQSYGDGYEQGLQKTGDPRTAQIMGSVGGVIDGVMEQWLPETKIGKNIIRDLRGDVSEKIAAIIKKGGDPEDVLKSTKNILKPFVSEYLNVTGQEIAEEDVAVLLKQMTESIVSPKTAAQNDVMGELANTTWSTALQTFLPAVASGGASSKNRFTQKVFNDAAINYDYSVDALKKSLIKDEISQEEYNKSLSLLATHRNNIANAPEETESGSILPVKKRVEYAYQQTRININQKKLDKPGISNVEKELLEKKIKTSEQIQRSILIPEDPSSRPKTDDQWKERIANEKDEAKKEAIMQQHGEWMIEESKKQTDQKFSDEIKASLSEEENNIIDLIKSKTELANKPVGTMGRTLYDSAQNPELHKQVIKELIDQSSDPDALELSVGAKITEAVRGLTEKSTQKTAAQVKADVEKAAEKVSDLSVNEMIDKPGTYKGENGFFYKDGQTVVFKVEGQNKEYELGNVEQIGETPIADFDISHQESVVGINDNGNVIVRGSEYANKYSDPLAAINRDENGNVVSVNLETPEGKKRTFRGNIAEDIAYQISLKEINKNDETKSEFEQHLNEDVEAAKEMEDGGLSETPKEESVKTDEVVSREKIEPKQPVKEQAPKEESVSVPQTSAKVVTEKENPNLKGKAFIEVRDGDGKLIGTLGILTDTGVYEKDGKKYASINGVSTTPEFRGKGRAIDLYRHAIEEVKKMGFEGLYSSDAEVVDKKAINKIREKLIVEDIGDGDYLYTGIKDTKSSKNESVSVGKLEKDYDLSKSNINDAEYDIMTNLGFEGLPVSSGYGKVGDTVLRVKNHTPDWANFTEDIEDNGVKKVVNVTVGDYQNTDSRRSKTSLEEMKAKYPNIQFVDIKIKDGESVNDAIQRVGSEINQEKPESVSVPEENNIESFETSKGSVYTVLPDGRTQRFKTKTGEQNEPQDLTVFVDFKGQQEDNFLEAIHRSKETGDKVYVADENGKVVRTNEEAKGKKLSLVIVDKDGKSVERIDAVSTPKIGSTVFDMRSFDKDGETFTQRHIGNTVSKINPKPKSQKTTVHETKPVIEEKPNKKAVSKITEIAEKIRSGKINKLGGFKSSTGFDAIWDASLEIVAKTLEATESVFDAIKAGLDYFKKTDWYKNLSDKKDFEDKYTAHMEEELKQSSSTKTDDSKPKTFNFFKNRALPLTGEQATHLSKETIEAGTEQEITQPFEYDKQTLDNMLDAGKKWMEDAKQQFNSNATEYATTLLKDLKSMKGRPSVKGVAMVSLLNSIDNDIKYKDLTAGERSILKSVRTQLQDLIADNAREGSLTLNAQRLIYKLYHGDYKFTDAMEDVVTKPVQKSADSVVEKMKKQDEDISDAAKNAKRKKNESEPKKDKEPKKKKEPKEKKTAFFSKALGNVSKEQTDKLKKDITDLANGINCGKKGKK